MAAFYTTIVSSRTTDPDLTSLLQTMRTVDSTIGIQATPGVFTYVVKKSTTDWTAQQITQATNAINAAATATPELSAQAILGNLDIVTKAILLTLIDQINVLRTAASLPTVTVAQAIQAVQNKAATL